jgi:hypothetical protein
MNASALHFENEAMLDNPILNSLATRHAHLVIAARIWGMVLLVASPAGATRGLCRGMGDI